MSCLSESPPRAAGPSASSPRSSSRDVCAFIPSNGPFRPRAGSKIKGGRSYSYRSSNRTEWVVLRIAETDSTNRLLAEIAEKGAPMHTVLVADHQTAGRGKGQRRWHSLPGKGLYASILLRPGRPVEELASVTLVVAVAVLHAVRQTTGIPATVKWPNDIMVDGRKLCGILCELVLSPDGEVKHIIAGIGLNENLAPEDFPHSLTRMATSLSIESGRPIDRAASLANLLDELAHWLELWEREGFEPVRQAWLRHSCTLGRKVTLDFSGFSQSGIAIGLGADGSLGIRDDEGKIHSYLWGETRWQAVAASAALPSTK